MTVIPNGDKISRPPFPLGEMYVDIVWKLNTALQENKVSYIQFRETTRAEGW